MIRGVLVLSMLLATARADAEDIAAYQAEGEAAAAGADPRVAALDAAFARAVQSALADVVPGDLRVARKAELDREIVGHARLWVAKFSVTKDETNGDRRQLEVSVRIDRDKIRARLAELHIQLADSTAPPPDAPPTHSITILVRVATPAGIAATFGSHADKDLDGIPALTTALRAAGLAVRRAPTGDVPFHADGDLPLSDEEASAICAQAGADLALVAGVTQGTFEPTLGRPGQSALITARVALVDCTAKKARARAQGASFVSQPEGNLGYAIDRALLAATSDVLPQAPQKLAQPGAFHGDDTPLTEPGVVLVRVPSRVPWSMIQLEQRYLSGARGVRAATLRRASPSGWVIGVQTGESIDRIAQIVKKPPASDTSPSVKIVGDVIELDLSGAP